jgi:hypothetical protein
VINATTHQGAEGVLRTQAQPIRRISSRTLLLLMGGELLLLFGVLIWAVAWILPASAPFAPRQDLTPVIETVRGSLSGAISDPLIDVTPGVSVRASNLRGLSLGGSVYYYYIEGQTNFDPLSRGAVADDAVEVMLRDTSGPSSIVIYRLR